MAFYEDKGMIRYTMILPKEPKEKIEKLAKSYMISQGEVLEVLLDKMDLNVMEGHFKAKREAKVSLRKGKIETRRRQSINIGDLSPDAIAVVQQTIAKLRQHV